MTEQEREVQRQKSHERYLKQKQEREQRRKERAEKEAAAAAEAADIHATLMEIVRNPSVSAEMKLRACEILRGFNK